MPSSAGRVRVWDVLVRLLHWSLVIGFFAAYFTRHSAAEVHEWLGYAVLAIIFIRFVWGFIGSPYARFQQFLRSPRYTLTYAREMAAGSQARYLGHNPLGAWMIMALLVSVLSTCLSGWLYTTDRFWGLEWVEDIHELFTWLSIALIVFHILGVILASRHDHENLAAAMMHGTKRAAAKGDVS